MDIALKLTSAIAINGTIVAADHVVVVQEADARSLLHRGKAVLANADDAPKVAPKLGMSVGPTMESDEGPDPEPVPDPVEQIVPPNARRGGKRGR